MAVVEATPVALIWGLAVLFVASLIFRFASLIRRGWQLEKLLSEFPCPPKHWFYGHIMGVFNDKFMHQLEAFSGEFSPCFQIHIGPFARMLNLVHPDTVKTIYATTEPKDRVTKVLWKDWLGDGLLISSGQKWARNRRLLTPAFHFDILKPYVKIYNESTHVMLEKWKQLEKDTSVELFKSISLLTLDSLQKCIFSLESNCQHTGEHDEYFSAIRDIGNLTIKRVRDWKVLLMGSWFFENFTHDGRQWRLTLDRLHSYSRRVIDQRLQEVNAGGKSERQYMDFLDILVGARDEDGTGLSYQEIQDEVDTFMFEGHDTTASGISWILYNLARHPTHQQKCRQEINAILDGKENDELDWNDIHNIPYTTMCIKESLRIHPPVPKTSRLITKSRTFPDGRVVHPGTTVILDVNSVHHNPRVWEDPYTYDPMRFSPENSKDRSSHAFVPFAAGPRNCIGQNFAMNEMKVVTALVLRHFELTVSGCPKPIRESNIVLRVTNGIHVKIRPRKP